MNLRDESHAGDGLARMHIIYFDNVLCPIANYLKAEIAKWGKVIKSAGVRIE